MLSGRKLQNNLQSDLNDRRSFIKLLSAAPLFAVIGARGVASVVASTTQTTVSNESFSNNIYTRLGVRPLINCRGPWTYLTASLELPEVRAASEAAAHYFVDLFELQAAAGRRLAQLSGAESGMVTSGSAGAISSATAGCIAGSDPRNIYQLPDTTGMKGEVIILGSRTPWDSCIRLTGAKLIVVPTINDLPAALTSQTAMVYTTWGDDEPLHSILKITKPAGVPVMVDLASAIPPYSNFTRLAKTGVDLFCFSGGKGMRGPQVSGVLLGRKDLIEAALYNTNPWEGSICRPMKVGKEEIMGVLAAVEYWSKADIAAIDKTWQLQMERIAKLVSTVPGVQPVIETPPPEQEDSFPTLTVTWDEQKFGLTVAQCEQQLREGNPRIEVSTRSNPSGVLARERPDKIDESRGGRPNHLRILSLTLQPGEDLIVGNRLRQVLAKARKQSA
jgi:seryl-tRNA(Sec) selenium transferase